MIHLKDKTAIVMGVANAKSIALHIGRTLKKAGAKVIYTYEGERTKIAIENLVDAEDLKIACDVLNEQELDALLEKIKSTGKGVDIIVHSIAFATQESLAHVENVSREDFNLSMDISVHSLLSLVSKLKNQLNNGSSIISLSYLASQRAASFYGMMGISKAALESTVRYMALKYGKREIRVNAISAGPLKTTSARAIPNFHEFNKAVAESSALGRAITHQEVADTALFLASNLSKGMTGQILYVDAGFSAVMPTP